MKYTIGLLSLIIIANLNFAQEKVYNTFNTTRIGDGHSTETLWRKELDLFFGHKFGDYSNGLKNTFNTTDVSFGADFGITNNLLTGFCVSKGAGPTRELVNVFLKQKIMQQEKNGNPLNIAIYGNTSYSTMEASIDSTSPVSFQRWEHRLSYTFQALISRKINDRISLQFMPTLMHRNFVAFEDVNTMASIGLAGRYQINKIIALTAEYYANLPSNRTVLGQTYYNPLSIGVEFNTGGHVFRILFSNSAGFTESQFLPYTNSTWKDAGFRIGFAFGRLFKL